MNEIPDELLLYRAYLRDAVERDLRRRRVRIAIPAVVVGGATTAAVVLGLTLGDGPTTIATKWNAGNIAMTGGKVLGPLQQFLIVGGGLYVEQGDGTWLHYADASNVPDVLAGRVQLARHNVAGNSADEILSLTTGIAQTTQPGGTTVYTGTIPERSVDPDTLITLSDDVLMMWILSHRLGDPGDPAIQLRMVAGSDGAVREVDLTRGNTMKFTFSDLGSTPPIIAPADATEMAPDAVPPAFANGGKEFAAK